MPLPNWAQPLRARLRQRWINWGYRRRGLHSRLPRQRPAIPGSEPGWCWGACQTPVKRRGDAQADADRLHNMGLAIERLDGLVLAPGEVLSFWHHVPRPVPRNGYRAGPMLVGGELRREIGGGLCQVSTTLFGALLQAGCTLLEHSNHSRDVHGEERHFVLGQDAAVAYGFKNLLARNDHRAALRLAMALVEEGDGWRLQAALWGQCPSPQSVRIESRLIEHIPPTTPAGRAGYRVETLRWTAPAQDPAATAESEEASWRLDYRFLYHYLPVETHAP